MRDPVTGQVYLRARDYSPGTGRFTSRDTVQPNAPGSQGWNPYAYAANNPVTFTDPSGHAFELSAVASVSAAGWLAFDVGVVGSGPVLLGVAVFPVLAFLLLAVIFFLIVHTFEVQFNCAAHGVSAAACGDPLGTAIGTALVDILHSLLHIELARTTFATPCTPGAKNGDAAFSVPTFVSNCPTLPKAKDGEDDCGYPTNTFDTGIPNLPDDEDKSSGGAAASTERREHKIRNQTSGKAAADDIPSWARNAPDGTPYDGESSDDFAKRMMDYRYGKNGWTKNMNREYSQLKKWGDRAFEDPPSASKKDRKGRSC